MSREPITRRTGFVTATDGVRIYFEVCGAGPPIVLVHGLGGNHAVWFHQVAAFARSHTVVTLSQRGFAPSGGDRESYDVELVVRDLEAVMDAASVATAVVVGQSMGGWTALGMAMTNPQRVRALVLADTLGGISDDAIAMHMRNVATVAASATAAALPLGAHPALSDGFSQAHPNMAYLYQTLATFGSPAPGDMAKKLGGARVPAEALKAFRVPTLFVVGTEDRLFPPALVRTASAYIDGAEVVEIAETGHSPYFEQPQVWNDAVADFIARRAAL